MYPKTKHKRNRIKARRFLEETFLPLILTVLIMMGLLIIAVSLGFQFASWKQMVFIISLISLLIGSIVFEVCRAIIKWLTKK